MTNPIETAVAPLKNDAVEYARQQAQKHIDTIIAELEAADWDAQVVAPYPSSIHNSTEQYHSKLRKYNAVRELTVHDNVRNPYSRSMKDPEYRARSDELADRLIKNWMEMAAHQYEAFVAKLISKIGECRTATLEGNHVWSHSILLIEKQDGSVEKWKTQMIYKISCKGKPHNQWPTRKVK